MCEPATITAGVLALAGTAAQLYGQHQAQQAQSRVAAEELARQQAYQNRALGAVDQGRQAFGQETGAATEQAAAARREAQYRAVAQPTDTAYLPGQGDAPQIVRTAMDTERGRIAAALGDEAARRAALGAWGDALLAGRIALARSGLDAAREAGFAAGSRSVLPAEQLAARAVGQGWRTAGDFAVAGSQLAAPAVASVAPTWASIFGSARNRSTAGAPVGAREPLTGFVAGGTSRL